MRVGKANVDRMLVLATVLTAVLAILALPARAATSGEPAVLVPDGDFEHPVAPPSSFLTLGGGAVFQGWHVVVSIDIVSTGFITSGHGAQSIDLNGPSTSGGVWRAVATQPGHPYELLFDLTGNPDTVCGPQGTKTLQVTAGGASQVYLFDTTGHTNQSPGWVARHLHFVAESSITQISFMSESPSCAGPMLDFVRLAPPTG